jgi:hypothetical protein
VSVGSDVVAAVPLEDEVEEDLRPVSESQIVMSAVMKGRSEDEYGWLKFLDSMMETEKSGCPTSTIRWTVRNAWRDFLLVGQPQTPKTVDTLFYTSFNLLNSTYKLLHWNCEVWILKGCNPLALPKRSGSINGYLLSNKLYEPHEKPKSELNKGTKEL